MTAKATAKAKTKVQTGYKRPASVPASASASTQQTQPSSSEDVAEVQGLLGSYHATAGDWSVVPPQIKDEIFNNSQCSMEKLFGDVAVGSLIELSLTWFSDDGGSGMDIDWYVEPDPITKKGDRPAIIPSPFNRDLQEQTCEEYKHKLLSEGQPQSVAGERLKTICCCCWSWLLLSSCLSLSCFQ